MNTTTSTNAVLGHRRQRPLIPLNDGKGKIRLKLRKTSLQKELDELPSDSKSLIELLIQSRARVNGGIYEVVTIWNKLRRQDQYWRPFGFHSEPQFLAHFGLPDGSMLATWTIMVEIFDRATFILLGDATLLFLTKWVSQYQADLAEKKRDFEAIFDRYCRERNDFDRSAFYQIVQTYVEDRYEKPLAKSAGMTHEKWLQNRRKPRIGGSKKPSHTEGLCEPLSSNQELMLHSHDKYCGQCARKATLIKLFVDYTNQLEYIIRERLSEGSLPERNKNLTLLVKMHSKKK